METFRCLSRAMLRICSVACAWMLFSPTSVLTAADAAHPNVLFIIADDASCHFGEAYGCSWVKTPNIDALARQGLVFENAYTPTSKCAPSRAAIMTGRNPWQLEEAANHQPYFPAKFNTFTEALAKAGIHCGGAGKTWGPGEAKNAEGQNRNFGLATFGKAQPNEPGSAFETFLKAKPEDKPFFYWFGSHNPHRPYTLDAGLAAGKKTTDIDRVPAYWPDNETVRRDMLDYATKVEAYDAQIGSLLKALEESGQANNTLVIVTSDHGMPFPRVKGHTYDDAHHIPFVVRWPSGISQSGQRVKGLLSFIDLAPTFLELLGVDGQAHGMSPMTGQSLTTLIKQPTALRKSASSGSASNNATSSERAFVLLGRERNDVLCRSGTPAGLGYPARAIRHGDYLYIQNFKADRWPCGNPEIGFKDTDDGPTKQFIEKLGEQDPYWQHAFGKRPADQLFNVKQDPDCVKNLAMEPGHAATMLKLREMLTAELTRQRDPRVLGEGDVFDNYLSPRTLQGNKAAKEAKAAAKENNGSKGVKKKAKADQVSPD